MPEYAVRNSLAAREPLPRFYWTGETDMRCLRAAIGQTLEYGYAHHIQRLMVTGLFALLLGVEPKQVHEWYLAMYVDAVEWVELPNTIGMSQYADGGIMASKPYVATGKYIQRMSNYCTGCRYDPAVSTGPDACPFTTLYWDFLMRHDELLRGNPRMLMQIRNADRLSPQKKAAIQIQAESLRKNLRPVDLTPLRQAPIRMHPPASRRRTRHPRLQGARVAAKTGIPDGPHRRVCCIASDAPAKP